MLVFPNCKINIGLNILSKRTDGFHNIETLLYPVPWTDILEIIPSDYEEFKFEGIQIECSLHDNLCYKAYQIIKEDYRLPPIQLFLYKNIPNGAGLGGGSADAAFTLMTLNQLFSLQIDETKLMQYASKIGSDCAFFIKNNPAFAIEKGDVFSESQIILKGYYLLIVKPPVHISTAEAYNRIKPRMPEVPLNALLNRPVSEWHSLIRNDFETPVFAAFPELSEVKKRLYEMAVYASMSGSGSALYGLFDEKIDYQKEFPNDICWMKRL